VSWRSIDLERRYADPAHASDWTAEDRPPWTPHNERGKLAFAAWASAQLDELERRVRAEREAALEPNAPEFAATIVRALKAALPLLEQRLAGARDIDPKAGVNDLATAEARRETGQAGMRGRTASRADSHSPAAKAARDLWRLRHVILPRFWPTAGRGGVGPTNDALAQIAAARHYGAEASAVLSWYNNERLARL
jgi:hypothetical protein